MIALLAAVPEETRLIRAAIQDTGQKTVAGISMTTGTIYGQNICLSHSGIGKAAAAAATVALLSHCQPQGLFLFGCGGAYLNSGLVVGDLALASQEIFGDEGVSGPNGFADLAAKGLPMRQEDTPFFNIWPTDQALLDWARPLLADHAASCGIKLSVGAFVTVSTCTGTTAKSLEIEQRTGGICENMEGAATALACRQLATPLLEVRGISNLVEDRDTRRWDLPAGMAAAQRAVLTLFQNRSETGP